MKLTPAILIMRSALARVLVECAHPDDPDAHWQVDPEFWYRKADDYLADSQPLAVAVDRVRREAFESGASPALSVLLTELEEAVPGQYQDGLARAVLLLSQEMGMHYGSVFEAGVRIGRTQAGGRDGEPRGKKLSGS